MRQTIPIAAFANATSRGVAMLVNFLSIPIALDYLGAERFGIWVAGVSFVMMLATFGDGGVGLGLVTAVAKEKARQGARGVQETVSSALAMVVPFTLGLLCAALILWPFINWHWLYSIESDALAKDASATTLVVLCSVLAGLTANVLMNARHGLQHIIAISSWNIVASASIIPTLLLGVSMELPMPWIAAAMLAPPVIVRGCVHLVHLLINSEHRPALKYVNKASGRLVLGTGSAFFIIALSQAASLHSDQLIIVNILGPEKVVAYALFNRLFALPIFLAAAVLNVMWPKFAEMVVGENYDGIRSGFNKTMLVTCLGGGFCAVVLWLLLDHILRLWVGYVPAYDSSLALGMLFYSFIVIPVSGLTLLIISLEVRKAQFVCSILMAVMNLVLTIVLVKRIGPSGAIIATGIAYFFCLFVPYLYMANQKIQFFKRA